MKPFQPADHLHSRTFIGLLVAQFFAAFNDQAIHAAAMFYAINLQVLNERDAISMMPLLFYLPWALFATVAGHYADKYSKFYALTIWKVVEVAITLLALLGFYLGRHGYPDAGVWIVLACVFLMGTHSAFFVPAKYGVMAEILTPRMISRGNGMLESLSFLAVILGTVAGGVLSSIYRGQEYMIGVILVGLAVIGAVAAFLIEKMPAAHPKREFPSYVYKPLWRNLKMLLGSRPLFFTVTGIAFFTFLVAYMRQVVYMHGQTQLPPWSEATTSYIVGVVALGIGLGSPLVGYLSGGKIELGLVPIGALGMMLATTAAAFFLDKVAFFVACIALIGFFTGFYLVPLFSMLQHRSPKSSKGDSIATSNFINISGAIAASVIFASLNYLAVLTNFTPPMPPSGTPVQGVMRDLEIREGHPERVKVGDTEFIDNHNGPTYNILRIDPGVRVGQEVVARSYTQGDVTYVRFQRVDEPERPFRDQSDLPSLLFLGAGLATLVNLGVLWWLLPDLFRRTGIWATSGVALETAGLLRLPGFGPILVVHNARDAKAQAMLTSGLDRRLHFIESGEDVEASVRRAKQLLEAGEIVAAHEPEVIRPLMPEAETLPVCHYAFDRKNRPHAYLEAGSLLAAGTPIEIAERELHRLEEHLRRMAETGEPLEKEAGH
jgi:MFS family permease